MRDLEQRQIALSTGVTLNVAVEGPQDRDAIVFLHGFPESHRTWRHQFDALKNSHFCIAPDQRGFAKSDKPEGVENYETGKIIEDVIALADALEVDRFTLAGHDWGGAVAWGTAITRPDRIARLVIANAPHPLLFTRALYEDRAQREASQYMRAFRDPANDAFIEEHGLAAFLAKTVNWDRSPEMDDKERDIYFEDWARPGAPFGMLNWYRAAQIAVPEPDEEMARPAILDIDFPVLEMPVLVVWGMEDLALLPGQTEGLEEVARNLTFVKIEEAGHFVPWEAPDKVNAAIEEFLAANPLA